ncbi:aldehyde dehydrogenase family protein, partial [Edaphobacter sp. HDX4]|uniref:aldehyde dehydrogenase family protein n=1 Tax=Edaphobacter sp. HDX4 TaxID=2794064 RepID=UPI002FE6893B
VETWVKEAIDRPGKLLTGGARISSTVFQPTVILEPSPAALVSQQEVFGPLPCIYGYADLEDAIACANNLPFAFQAAVFTSDIHAALTTARLLDASAVLINDHTAFRTDWMPFPAGARATVPVVFPKPCAKCSITR